MRKDGPGPGKYVLPPTIGCKTHDPRKNKGPCYSIGKRLRDSQDLVGPGPGKYALEKYNRYGKEHFPSYIGQTLHISPNDQAPAPNAYALPTPNVCGRRQPAYAIASRLVNRFDTGIPGPNIYKLPKVLGPNTGPVTSTPKAPAYSIAKRLNVIDKSATPGPKYLPKFIDQGKLPATLKFRPKDKLDADIPGPKYNLQHHRPGKKSPAYSLGRRYPEWVEPNIIQDDY